MYAILSHRYSLSIYGNHAPHIKRRVRSEAYGIWSVILGYTIHREGAALRGGPSPTFAFVFLAGGSYSVSGSRSFCVTGGQTLVLLKVGMAILSIEVRGFPNRILEPWAR